MPTSTSHGSAAILAVDDDALIRAQLKDIIEGAGHRALLADRAEAIDVLLAERPAIAFVDITLPGIHGDVLCRKLRERSDTWDLPIVLMTAGERIEVVRRCLTSGADDFITKPVGPSEILSKVKAVLEGTREALPRPAMNKRVLIATQNAFFRATVGKLLTHSGCEVRYSVSLVEVRAAAEAHLAPDVAIIDLDLGREAADLETVRSLKGEKLQNIPVVTMASTATLRSRIPAWAATAPLAWASLAPYDVEEERDELVRHLNRLLVRGQGAPTGRRKPRVPFYAPVRFRAVGASDWQVGFSFDLSEGGLFVRTLSPTPSGASVELEFRIFEDQSAFLSRGLVIWSNAYSARHMLATPYGMGVSFTDVPRKTLEGVREFVLMSKAPPDP